MSANRMYGKIIGAGNRLGTKGLGQPLQDRPFGFGNPEAVGDDVEAEIDGQLNVAQTDKYPVGVLVIPLGRRREPAVRTQLIRPPLDGAATLRGRDQVDLGPPAVEARKDQALLTVDMHEAILDQLLRGGVG